MPDDVPDDVPDQFIVVAGDLQDGLWFYGPFATVADADQWGQGYGTRVQWSIQRLRAPYDHTKRW